MKKIVPVFLLAVFVAAACQEKKSTGISAEKQFKIFHATQQEILKPTRWDEGSTTITNEDRLDLYLPYVKDLGGAYAGVGSIQNFQLAAWAKSEYIYLFDFTRIVVAVNKVHIAFLKNAGTPDEFMNLWLSAKKDEAIAIVKREYEGNPDLNFMLESMKKARPYLTKRFRLEKVLTEKRNYPTWLTNQDQYLYLQNLAKAGKILPLQGDLNGAITLKSIGTQLKAMGVPLRILYLSNAEEYLRDYSETFKANMLGFPADEKSLVVRTLSVQQKKYPWAPDSHYTNDNGFHYNVQPLDYFQKLIRTEERPRVLLMMSLAEVDKKNGFSETKRPATVPESK